MSSMRGGVREGQVYVGNLPPDVKTRDVEDLFYKYGKISFINLKGGNGGPPFAFLEFEDPRYDSLVDGIFQFIDSKVRAGHTYRIYSFNYIYIYI